MPPPPGRIRPILPAFVSSRGRYQGEARWRLLSSPWMIVLSLRDEPRLSRRGAEKVVIRIAMKNFLENRLGIAFGRPRREQSFERQAGKVATEHDPVLQAATN